MQNTLASFHLNPPARSPHTIDSFKIVGKAPSATCLSITGAASQSGNLTNWSNSSNTTLAFVDFSGYVTTNRIYLGTGKTSSDAYIVNSGGFVQFVKGDNSSFTAIQCGLVNLSSNIIDSNAGPELQISSTAFQQFGLFTNSGRSTYAGLIGSAITLSPTAVTSGSPIPSIGLTGAANTGLTASTEVSDVNFNLARTVQWATGALTAQRSVNISAPTIAFVGSSTLRWGSTFNITGSLGVGANATITNNFAMTIAPSSWTSTPLFGISGAGTITAYNSIMTAGIGSIAVYTDTRLLAQAAAIATLATYTTPAADGTYIVGANVNVTAATTCSFTVTCTYTDETNTSRTLTFSFVQNGVAVPIQTITNVTGVGAYSAMPQQIRCKASTTITIATTGTFTSVTYNAEGTVLQAA